MLHRNAQWFVIGAGAESFMFNACVSCMPIDKREDEVPGQTKASRRAAKLKPSLSSTSLYGEKLVQLVRTIPARKENYPPLLQAFLFYNY